MRRVRDRMVAVLAASTMALMITLPTVAATASVVPQHLAVAGAASAKDDFFNGDSCTSRKFCMAVGDFSSHSRVAGLSERLSGNRWVNVPFPTPRRGVNIFGNEVSCASPRQCLFVGDHYSGDQNIARNLAVAWNGRSWKIVTAGGPRGTEFSFLFDVSCPTTKFCMAVGEAGNGVRFRDTAYVWENGATWRRIAVPRPRRKATPESELAGLSCVNASNCMAVGDTWTSGQDRDAPFAVHWHSGRWKLMTVPFFHHSQFTTFEGVSCPTATQCMAVGETDTSLGAFYPVAEVWNGGRWHVSPLHRPSSSLGGVSCPTRNRCFAVGLSLAATWNGSTWRMQHPAGTPAPFSTDVLAHVSCLSRRHCEAVGFSSNPGSPTEDDRNLAEVWNGAHWKLQSVVNP